MKALQNFVLRTKAYIIKEQGKQLEFFQKKLQQQQHQHSGTQNHQQQVVAPNNMKSILNQRHRAILLQLRPFQKFFTSAIVIHQIRYFALYNSLYNHSAFSNESNMKRNLDETDISLQSSTDQKLPDQKYEGILEILDDSPKGTKYFCGRYIAANFQHVIETKFTIIMGRSQEDDNNSIYQSQYSDDDDQSNASGHSTPKNIEKIRNGVEVNNLPVMKSQILFSTDFENNDYQFSSCNDN